MNPKQPTISYDGVAKMPPSSQLLVERANPVHRPFTAAKLQQQQAAEQHAAQQLAAVQAQNETRGSSQSGQSSSGSNSSGSNTSGPAVPDVVKPPQIPGTGAVPRTSRGMMPKTANWFNNIPAIGSSPLFSNRWNNRQNAFSRGFDSAANAVKPVYNAASFLSGALPGASKFLGMGADITTEQSQPYNDGSTLLQRGYDTLGNIGSMGLDAQFRWSGADTLMPGVTNRLREINDNAIARFRPGGQSYNASPLPTGSQFRAPTPPQVSTAPNPAPGVNSVSAPPTAAPEHNWMDYRTLDESQGKQSGTTTMQLTLLPNLTKKACDAIYRAQETSSLEKTSFLGLGAGLGAAARAGASAAARSGSKAQQAAGAARAARAASANAARTAPRAAASGGAKPAGQAAPGGGRTRQTGGQTSAGGSTQQRGTTSPDSFDRNVGGGRTSCGLCNTAAPTVPAASRGGGFRSGAAQGAGFTLAGGAIGAGYNYMFGGGGGGEAPQLPEGVGPIITTPDGQKWNIDDFVPQAAPWYRRILGLEGPGSRYDQVQETMRKGMDTGRMSINPPETPFGSFAGDKYNSPAIPTVSSVDADEAMRYGPRFQPNYSRAGLGPRQDNQLARATGSQNNQ